MSRRDNDSPGPTSRDDSQEHFQDWACRNTSRLAAHHPLLGGCMTKRCELTLTDESLQAEIELLGDVIVAVSLMPRPMTEAELDEALGLSPIHDRDGSVVGGSTDRESTRLKSSHL